MRDFRVVMGKFVAGPGGFYYFSAQAAFFVAPNPSLLFAVTLNKAKPG
jgi:hypothetical protein